MYRRVLIRLCILPLLVVVFSAITVFSQPEIEQKRADAKAAYDLAVTKRGENSFASYQIALEKFQFAAEIYAKIGDKLDAGRATLGVGLICNLLGDTERAVASYLRALEIFREVGNKQLEATALNNIGLLYSETGDVQKAIEFHTLALPLRLATGDRYGESNTLNSLGAAFASNGERAKALDNFNRALAIRIEIDNKAAQAVTLSNLGRLFDDLGDKVKAIEYFDRSLGLRRAAGDRLGEAVTLNNLGMATADSGDLARAVAVYEESLAILTDLGLDNRKSSVLNNLSTAYIALGDMQKAARFARDALPIYRNIKDRSGEATALNNVAIATVGSGDAASALSYLNDALIIARSSRSRGLEAIVLGNLMRVSVELDRSAIAVIFGKQSINIYQELRANIRDLDSSIQRTYLNSVEENYRRLADLLIELGRFAEADEVLRMLKDEEFAAFTRRNTGTAKDLNRRQALTRKEKAVSTRYETLAKEVSQTAADLQKLEDRKRALSRTEQTLSADDEKRLEVLSTQLAAANSAFRTFLEVELVREVGTEVIRHIEVDRALQGRLRKWGDGTVLLHTVLTDGRYRVILTTPKIQIAAKTEIRTNVLNKKIFAFRKALADIDGDPRPLAKELYDILIKPIEKDLMAANAKTLVWSLDGVLRYIPLSALSPDGKSYLVEKFQNVILTSRTRDAVDDSTREWRALGFGISEEQEVTYPETPGKKQKVEALPGTKLELAAIIRDENTSGEIGILPGRRFLDKDFTLKNMADSLAAETPNGRGKYNVVHLASHFHLGRDWSSSFLFLGNGKLLTLEELSNTPQFDFGDVDIVTLSACNTALGGLESGREIDSLAGVIEAKSGKAVLATLWEVSDNSTPQLMREFYRARNENDRVTKAAALRQAQLKLLRSATAADGFSHPYFWSGFVLIGNWR